jgi:hypothetical protein
MKRIHSLVALSALVITGAGCAANPLVGSWEQPSGSGGFTFTTTINLAADGTATLTIAGSGSCSGMQTYQGITWSSSSTTLTFSAPSTGPSCSGMLTCMAAGTSVNIDCTQTQSMSQQTNGACTYALSNNNNTLTISACSGGGMSGTQTYTRAGSGS